MSAGDPADIVEDEVRQDLVLVEERLASAVESGRSLMASATGHVLTAGGKRFRPMLSLLSSRFGSWPDGRIIEAAVSIELVHLATLYHDDVIDEAQMRRGAASANARFDNRVAILAGDWLFARASVIASELGPYFSRVLAETILAVCEGQIMESEHAGTTNQSQERYLDVIRRKTAALLATSCHLGAWVAGVKPDVIDALTAYGDALGIAFQISDDVLDIAGHPEESGKIPGTDLREGVWTLPVLATLDETVKGSDRLAESLAAGDIDAALAVLRGNGSVELALEEAARYGRLATDALEPVPAGPAREVLERLARFVSNRSG